MLDAHLCIRLLLLCLLTLGLPLYGGGARPLAAFAAQVLPQDVDLLRSVETETAGADASAGRPDLQELVPTYRSHPPSMLLLLQKDGKISSYGLDDGNKLWTVDTGGDVLRVEVQQQPRERMIREDPLALPFILEGGLLFTRRCISPFHCRRQTSAECFVSQGSEAETRPDARPDEEEAGSSAQGRCETPLSKLPFPRCYMNLSTLIEKKHVQVGDTDIFVTTSAHIMDVNSDDGKPVPETNFLLTYLHLVRYDFTVHVRRPGEYSWQMNIAQFKLSEKSPLHVSDEDWADDDPLLVSRALQRLLRRGDCGGQGHVTSTKEGDRAGAGRLGPAAVDEGFRKDILAEQLMFRETDQNNYVLWSKLKHAALWSSAVSPLSTVVSAFVWQADTGRVQSLPIYRVEAITSITDAVEPLEREGADPFYLPVSVNSEPRRDKHPLNTHRFPTTWEFDIVADEAELRELQNSYQQCSWIYGCDDSAGNVPNNSPNDSNSKTSSQLALVRWLPLSHADTGNTLLLLFNFFCGLISCVSALLSVGFRWYLWNATGVGPDAFVDRIGNPSGPGSSKLKPLHRSFTLQPSGRLMAATPGNLTRSHTPEAPLSSTSLTLFQDPGMLPPSKSSMIRAKSMHHVDSWWKYSGDDDASLSDRPSSASPIPHNSHVSPQLFELQFQTAEKIGSGAEGSVFRVKHQFTGVSYAVKAIRIPDDNEIYIQEAMLHSGFDSVNVVRFFNAWIERVPQKFAEKFGLLRRDDTTDNLFADTVDTLDDKQLTEPTSSDACYTVLFIQTEWFGRGTLADHFVRRKSFTRVDNLTHLLQISEGLQYLHSQCVVHCDLKPRNIFMSDSGIMKIGDFGLSKKNRTRSCMLCEDAGGFTSASCTSAEEHSLPACTPLYCSPEQKRGEAATAASDIYSLGLIALEFYCEFTTQHERYLTLGAARQGVFPKEFVERYPAEKLLVQEMLSEDEDRRPAMKNIVKFLRQEINVEEGKNAVTTRSISLSPIRGHDSPNPGSPLYPSDHGELVTRVAPTFTRLSLSSLESAAFAHSN
ncbi:putative protein kinase [Trypanosoma conorhini]|uniref:non-specific serine/threonine protein kinase n=1 Tax=Trypanosoma conorhini TaxID=83891 RepID=A0A422P9N9_9TRYP|nr:putative protein kinase [Trypanosoma conorhini]RNF14410.1 putative protein kinase [Trypanosoma conorhini]